MKSGNLRKRKVEICANDYCTDFSLINLSPNLYSTFFYVVYMTVAPAHHGQVEQDIISDSIQTKMSYSVIKFWNSWNNNFFIRPQTFIHESFICSVFNFKLFTCMTIFRINMGWPRYSGIGLFMPWHRPFWWPKVFWKSSFWLACSNEMIQNQEVNAVLFHYTCKKCLIYISILAL